MFLPQFPGGEQQRLHPWMRTFAPLKEHLGGAVLVGHSLGVPFLLRVLERFFAHPRAAFFVGGFAGGVEKSTFSLQDFVQEPFDWKTIRQRCQTFVVIHSDNDPYVPLEKAEEMARNLGVGVDLVKGGGHFLLPKYRTFDFLLEKIDDVVV